MSDDNVIRGTMEEIRHKWYTRSHAFVTSLGLLSNPGSHISMPLARYIMCSWACIPVKTLIVGERPYGTNILPYAASAMSYNPNSNPQGTPSTITLATDVSNKYPIAADEVETWFRDSWKYLKCGVFLINACCYTKFMGNSLYERTCTEEFLRDMIYVSLLVKKDNIHVFPMGNPAQHSVGKVRSSVPSMREKVRVHSCPNPASLSHKKSDLRSPGITLNKPGVSKLLFNLVKSTNASGASVTEDDYYTMSSGPSNDLSTVASKTNALADEFAAVEEYFKSGAAANRDPSGEEVFKRAKEAASQFAMVINNAKIAALFATINEPPNVAKGAFKSRDRGYVPKVFQHGTSSNTSSKTTPVKKATPQNVGFADDDDEQPNITTPVMKRVTETPSQTPTSKKTVSTTISSTVANRPISVGFADDDSSEEAAPTSMSQGRSLSVSSDDILTAAEVESVTYVSDFIDSNSEYNFPASMSQEIHECIRTKRVSSDKARGLVESIRVAVANGDRSPYEALGYKDNITDMANPVLQWIVKQAE